MSVPLSSAQAVLGKWQLEIPQINPADRETIVLGLIKEVTSYLPFFEPTDLGTSLYMQLEKKAPELLAQGKVFASGSFHDKGPLDAQKSNRLLLTQSGGLMTLYTTLNYGVTRSLTIDKRVQWKSDQAFERALLLVYYLVKRNDELLTQRASNARKLWISVRSTVKKVYIRGMVE